MPKILHRNKYPELIRLYECNTNQRIISEQLDIPYRTVRSLIKRYQNYGYLGPESIIDDKLVRDYFKAIKNLEHENKKVSMTRINNKKGFDLFQSFNIGDMIQEGIIFQKSAHVIFIRTMTGRIESISDFEILTGDRILRKVG
jgi:hypothetical protein